MDTTLIKRFGAELDKLGNPDWLRDVCLIWDEVNLLGQVRRSNTCRVGGWDLGLGTAVGALAYGQTLRVASSPCSCVDLCHGARCVCEDC